MAVRVYVNVLACYDCDGAVTPLEVLWPDGRVFEVDRVFDVRETISREAGGQGIRYDCRIHGKRANLFDDKGRWFMEGK